MKIQAKLFIILMLFLGIMLVSKLESYADSSSNIPYVDIVKAEVERRLPEEYDSYCFVNQYNSTNDYNYYSIVYYNSDSSIVSTSDGYYVFSANLLSDVKICQFWSCCYSRSDRDFSYFKFTMTDNFLSPTNGNYYVRDLNRYFSGYVECVSNRVIYSSNATQESLINKFYDDLSFIDGGVEGDKINLYQLNLTDKNFNNTTHTFTLNTTEEDIYYEELTNLINSHKNYCLYLTDYSRLLTYENPKLTSNLVSGSYLLSGYIDFLVSENAYFYFSPHYNRVKSSSGDYISGTVTDKAKRFFFTLVYSDDSDSTYFSISKDNGSLWALSDTVNDGNSTSDLLEDIKNSYFIGSNQTIYYAKEDNNYILDGLTNSIYYKGCSDSVYYQKYGNSTMKTRGDDSYSYNFSFSGGGVRYFYLNDYTFEDDISNMNQSLNDKKENSTVIIDTSEGKSQLIPADNTTYTYIYNYVTNETESAEDEKHIETERNPFISDSNTDDTTGWSIWDFLKGIFSTIGEIVSKLGNLVSDLINGLISLFVPSGEFFSNLFGDLNDWFSLKLGFIFYPFELLTSVLNRIANIEFTNPILNIPDIREPVTGQVLFHAITFNFNDLLTQHESFQIMHSIYLTFVDVIIILGLVNLLRKKFEEVTTK